MGKKLTDRDLITAVIEQACVDHKDCGEGIIRRIEVTPEGIQIDFQMADGQYDYDLSDSSEFEWCDGFEDYGDEPQKA